MPSQCWKLWRSWILQNEIESICKISKWNEFATKRFEKIKKQEIGAANLKREKIRNIKIDTLAKTCNRSSYHI